DVDPKREGGGPQAPVKDHRRRTTTAPYGDDGGSAGFAAAGDELVDQSRRHTGDVAEKHERGVQARVERAKPELERARQATRGIWVAYDARAPWIDLGHEIAGTDHKHGVLETRSVRGVDHVLDERSPIERRKQLLRTEAAGFARREDHAADLRRLGLNLLRQPAR